MAAKEETRVLDLDHRPTFGELIPVVRQMLWEERWHRRLIRFIGKWWHMDWPAWWFRKRMALYRVTNRDCTRLLQREIDRVAQLATDYNEQLGPERRSRWVRGKVLLPRGVFIVKRPHVPDHVDIVWPRGSTWRF